MISKFFKNSVRTFDPSIVCLPESGRFQGSWAVNRQSRALCTKDSNRKEKICPTLSDLGEDVREKQLYSVRVALPSSFRVMYQEGFVERLPGVCPSSADHLQPLLSMWGAVECDVGAVLE